MRRSEMVCDEARQIEMRREEAKREEVVRWDDVRSKIWDEINKEMRLD